MAAQKTLLIILCISCSLFVKAQPSVNNRQADSVVASASLQYKAHSFLHKLLMGSNYRQQWAQPVTLPVLRLSSTSFIVKELGGGMQTKSLRLEDSLGKLWSLRTVDKDVAGAMPRWAKNTLAQTMSQQLISAAFPYAAPVVGRLATAAGIAAAEPTIYYVADDMALGEHRAVFANTVCLLEERDPGFLITDDTETMVKNVYANNGYTLHQPLLLKARLLDMVMADWDRHYDNWRWGLRDSAGLHYYIAVPRDRDWAFYHSNGVVPKLAGLAALRHLVNFQKKPKLFKRLNAKAQLLDKMFLNSLSAHEWQTAIEQLQQSLSDPVIASAALTMPQEIYNMEGKKLMTILKERLAGLQKPALAYYRYLAKDVQVDGSAQAESFYLRHSRYGLALLIYRKQADGTEGEKLYEREFDEKETYRLTINGLGGDDTFIMDEKLSANIGVTINGGDGSDSYTLKANMKIKVHDKAADNNIIVYKGKAGIHMRN